MANYEATRYDFSGANLTGIEGVNTGIVVPWGSNSIPSGFLLCDGQSVSQATYAALFAVIGITYGDPGGGNFNVPDLKDRTIAGVSVANSKALAQTIGANNVIPTGNISGSTGSTTLTSNQIPSHTHTFTGGTGRDPEAPGGQTAVVTGYVNTGSRTTTNTGGGDAHDHTLSANFSGTGNSVLQPTLVLNYIIKT